jgi:hypothetical protein
MAMIFRYTSAIGSFDIAVQYFKRLFSFVLCGQKTNKERSASKFPFLMNKGKLLRCVLDMRQACVTGMVTGSDRGSVSIYTCFLYNKLKYIII